jgi:hypothetical protein
MTSSLPSRLLRCSFVALAISCGGGGNGTPPPDFTTLSQLDAMWSLSGTFGLICNGTTEHEGIAGAQIPVFNGSFKQLVQLPTGACGISQILFQGAIALDGSLTGNVSTIGGNPVLSDVLGGTCRASACTGASVNTGLLTFSLSNTRALPFGSPWSVAIRCSDGTSITAAPVTLDSSGALVAGGSTFCAADGKACTASGSVAVTENFALQGNVTAHGALTATLMQGGSAGAVSFTAQPNAGLTTFTGTGDFGTTMTLTQCPSAGCPVCVISH